VGGIRQSGAEYAPNAQILFDRFHIVKHLNEAVDAVRRKLWRQLTSKEIVEDEIAVSP